MSKHVHDDNCVFPSGSICNGTGTEYVSRYRLRRARLWTVVKHHRSKAAAVRSMTEAFIEHRNASKADVIFCAEYYEPFQVCELVKR